MSEADRARNRQKREEVERAQEEAKTAETHTGFVVSGSKVHKKTFGAKPNANGGRDDAVAAAARRQKNVAKFKTSTAQRTDPGVRGANGSGVRLSGTAKRWNAKGFGFILPAAGGDDLFCHATSIKDGDCLREGAAVEYEEEFNAKKGKVQAVFVTGGETA